MTTRIITTLFFLAVISACKKEEINTQNECGAQSLSGSIKDVKWNHSNIKWYCTRWCSTLSEQETRDVFEYCFQQYSSVANITFTEANSPYDADIVVSFLDDRVHYISHLNYMKCPTNFNYNIFPEYGHAFLPYSNSSFSGQIHLNNALNFTLYGDASKPGLLQVFLHELGHAIGLNHSSTYNTVMYKSYNTKMTALSQEDVDRVVALYGIKQRSGGSNPTTPPTTNSSLRANLNQSTPIGCGSYALYNWGCSGNYQNVASGDFSIQYNGYQSGKISFVLSKCNTNVSYAKVNFIFDYNRNGTCGETQSYAMSYNNNEFSWNMNQFLQSSESQFRIIPIISAYNSSNQFLGYKTTTPLVLSK